MDRVKVSIFHYLQRNAFLTVLVCASIPNPLFDLAGITCGHFLIPFGTFFSATCLGKAFFKTHLQIVFVVLVFSKTYIDYVLSTAELYLPFLKGSLSAMFQQQKENLMNPKVQEGDKPMVAALWDLFILGMVVYFLWSILDSLVNSRAEKQKQE